ncbi:sensor histidine kinase [Plantactinospora soyae]|uniref:histidine kinase n=1 Tax=Plantactinospora soyae TaxID=1544732 RepID=A0A927MDS3_9ACTN|nr:sensor histidine kinase [Plantactinospora soyae]MBE1489893.1 signal transduction histidine kinase [Plantactinospora soyae]
MRERRNRLIDWGRTRPPLVVDALIAIVCYVFIVVNAFTHQRTEWWVFLLAGLNATPLVWRRRYPFRVTALVGVGTTWLALEGTLGEIPTAQLVATYTFAALCPPVQRVILMLGTLVGVIVSVPPEKLLEFGPSGIAFLVAYAMGVSARARRDRIAMLEERAHRLAEEQDASAARERERIAREVHDILAHSMSLVVVQAEAGPVVVRTDPGKAEEVFDTISATAREALTQLRRTLGVLRAEGPVRAPLPDLDAVPPLVEGARRAGLVATLEEHGERRPVPADLGVTAYRIVQESLTNTLRHAGAGQVRVRLDWADAVLRLEVSDDGRGRPGAGRPDGHGLVGMRERVSAVGGVLTTGPGPDGTGFRVAATLPLR